METNCLLYMPLSGKLFAAYVDDEGYVSLCVPGHGGGWGIPLSNAFLDAFNITIYPG